MRTHRSQARETAYAQWSHEQRRDALPPHAGDDIEKVQRIETALLTEANPTHRSLLLRELVRLKDANHAEGNHDMRQRKQ
jgi:hypothetical protein